MWVELWAYLMDLLIVFQNDTFDPSRPQSLTECIVGEPRLQKLINES